MSTDDEETKKVKDTIRKWGRNNVALLVIVVGTVASGIQMKENGYLIPNIVHENVKTTKQNFFSYVIMFSILYGLISGGVWFGFAEFLISKL
jgi:hypothetical protein